MDIFLHGFGTTPEIWPGGGPQLYFDNLEREADRIGQGMARDVRVIGWSMGGMVAQLIAAKYPEKVERLVLISTTPKFIATDDFPCGLPAAALKRLGQRIQREGMKAFHSLVFPDGHRLGLANLAIDQAERELAALGKTDFRAIIASIKAPTLIIHGDRDEICPPGAALYMNRAIAGSRLLLLKGVGHAPMIEAPGRFKEALCRTNN
jgi:pimeloyl-[acyl-carrier protein] methyl ester esterase